jgi:threonylcarbamoyladenosine tRNA methylthiotransferase MtaB
MGRRHTFEDVLSFANKLRQVRSDATLGADLIAGFPTETELHFQRTLDLIQEAQITHAHVFPYSIRPGTPAAKMPMVPKSERIKRAQMARDAGQLITQAWLDKMIGKKVSVLIEQDGFGYTDTYMPVRTKQPTTVGQIMTILITGRDGDVLVG